MKIRLEGFLLGIGMTFPVDIILMVLGNPAGNFVTLVLKLVILGTALHLYHQEIQEK